jgi:hypothetical protein
MKHSITFAFMFMMVRCVAFAQIHPLVTDPEVDYISTSDSVCAEFGILKKDEVLRRDLDLDDSGRLAVFLRYNSAGSKGGASWTAYVLNNGGLYYRIDNVQLREDFLRVGKVPELNPLGGLMTLWPGKGGGILVRYCFVDGKSVLDEQRTLDYSNADDQRIFELAFKRKIGTSMPDEYFKNPPHKVIAVKDIVARMRPSPQLPQPMEGTSNAAQPNPPDVLAVQNNSAPKSEKVVTPVARRSNDVMTWIIGGIVITLALVVVLVLKRSA